MEIITQVINDLGNFIFIPIIFFVLMVALRRPVGEAIQSAMRVGIGFIALSMVTNFMLEKLQPSITGLSDKMGSSLNAVDVGGAATAVMGYGSTVGAFIIILCVGVNLLMLVLKLTDCVNVDVFNLHQNASMGAIVAIYSGNLLYGFLTAALFHVFALITADLGKEDNEKFFGLPKGVSISHPVANTYLIFAYPFNWLFDHIPGIRNINITADTIKKHFGMLGDPSVIGFILGTLLGLIGLTWDNPYKTVISSLQLGMYLGAVMILLPKMTSIMMEGLVPLSNAARKQLVKRFPNRDINVGMDSAIIIGDADIVASSLLLIPSLVVLATILPGNNVMPIGDLPMLVFYIACMVPVFKGNIFRTWLSSLILFGAGFYIASWMTPATNEAFIRFGGGVAKKGVMFSSIDPSANPFTALFAASSHVGIIGYILIGLLLISIGYFLRKKKAKTLSTE